MSRPALFTIGPERPFLHDLVDGLYADPRWGLGGNPAALARMRIFLPTRRACRALADVFVEANGGRPLLLPRITPLGDIDEEYAESSSDQGEHGYDAAALAAIPAAIPPLRRQFLLARLVSATKQASKETISPEQAAILAVELARLIDQVHTERLEFSALVALAPEDFARHWQITLDFLRLITDHWPKILAEEGGIDPADRRNRLLQAQAASWRAHPPSAPIIAAGSTGSIPATADLLAVIATLPLGAVVLPGLDLRADEATWTALEPSHPQYGLAQLLDRLKLDRTAVRPWPEFAAPSTPTASLRSRLINLVLRPAATAHASALWPPLEQALAGCTRIVAPTPQEEARTIALILREALFHKRRGVLITPERTLARRVAADLGRWGIAVDDSAGVPLDRTEPGTFLRLTARMLADHLAPVSLLAALKHPLAAAGMAPGAFRHAVRRLELTLLRGPRPAPGLDGLKGAFDRTGGDAGCRDLIARLRRVMTPTQAVFAPGEQLFQNLLGAHLALVEALAEAASDSGAARVWRGDAGEAALAFVTEAHEAAGAAVVLPAASYPALLTELMSGRTVRPRYGLQPDLAILGPLEARLISADVVVLAGLNEGAWPARAQASPWMSRQMMESFGLPLPERRIGLSAHDFAQAFCAPSVYLTRAARVEGAPTVPSRWLVRLENVVGNTASKDWLANGSPHLRWQDELDRPAAIRPVEPPQPRPPVAARPRQLSVTQIEAWMRNPYSIYGRHILGLKRLKPIDEDPSAADYGQFVHTALDLFVKTNSSAPLDASALDQLLAIGRGELAQWEDRPSVRAFWWPRFERIARWFVATEEERREDIVTVACEAEGRLTLGAPAGPFTLTARADRIDQRRDASGLVIVDYKTGTPPDIKEIQAGFAPQLPLEAAMAQAGAFIDVAAASVAALEFWHLHGKVDGGAQSTVKCDDAAALGRAALEGVQELLARFDLAETAYLARPRASAAPKFDDYEHLARVREWSAGPGASEE
ncbi:MAG: double-strand break repair protein AddB [Rhodospirillales bacterium]|nr:double-strand break repair protein AddB [Rhodospirillales bacterium]